MSEVIYFEKVDPIAHRCDDFLLVLLDVIQRLAAMCFRDAVDDIGEFTDVPPVNLSVEESGDARFRLDDVRDLAGCRAAR